jgi:hypothetical protein
MPDPMLADFQIKEKRLCVKLAKITHHLDVEMSNLELLACARIGDT